MTDPAAARLEAGDLPPRLSTAVPGPQSLALHRRLLDCEPAETAPVHGVVWRQALGSNVLDVDGNRFLDLTSGFGVAAVGHRHPRVVSAVQRQAEELLHGLADAQTHPARVELSERLAGLAPWADARVLHAVSGSDAVELAIKTAVLATGRSTLVAFDPGYHGLTLGALHATSRPAFRAPFAPHLADRVVRLPFGCPMAELEEALAEHRPAAVVAEPIVGREGVLIPPDGWLDELATASRRHGALLIADEIFVGFGRTGERFESVARMERPPELICCGKALGGGLPIAAVLGPESLLRVWNGDSEARHTATFVAHPLAVVAALATLEVLEEEHLAARARSVGEPWGRALRERLAPCRDVEEVRGRGLLWGVQFDTAARADAFSRAALEEGLLLLAGGPEGRVAQLVPPLTIGEEQLRAALDAVERAALRPPPHREDGRGS